MVFVILYLSGQYPSGLLLVLLFSGCIAFLPYNFRRKKIFLGESGSTFLGFTLACASFTGYWAKDGFVKLAIPALILGVPIFDMIFTNIMRLREGKIMTVNQWFEYADKDHFHHYLVDIGLRPKGAVVFIYFVTLSLGLSALMVSNDTALEGLLSLSQAGIIFSIIAILIVLGKRHRSGWGKAK